MGTIIASTSDENKIYDPALFSEVGLGLVDHATTIFANPAQVALKIYNTPGKFQSAKQFVDSAKEFVQTKPIISAIAFATGGAIMFKKNSLKAWFAKTGKEWVAHPKSERFIAYTLVGGPIRLASGALIPMGSVLYTAAVEGLESADTTSSSQWILCVSMVTPLLANIMPMIMPKQWLINVFNIVVKYSPQALYPAWIAAQSTVRSSWSTATDDEEELMKLEGSLAAHVAPLSGTVQTLFQPFFTRAVMTNIYLSLAGQLDDYAIALAGDIKRNPSKAVAPIVTLELISNAVQLIINCYHHGMSRNQTAKHVFQMLITIATVWHFYANEPSMANAVLVASSTIMGSMGTLAFEKAYEAVFGQKKSKVINQSWHHEMFAVGARCV